MIVGIEKVKIGSKTPKKEYSFNGQKAKKSVKSLDKISKSKVYQL
jgi:hypothetical protein